MSKKKTVKKFEPMPPGRPLASSQKGDDAIPIELRLVSRRKSRFGPVGIQKIENVKKILEILSSRLAMCLDSLQNIEGDVEFDGVHMCDRGIDDLVKWVTNLEGAVSNAAFLAFKQHS